MDTSDHDLIQRFQAGDDRAFVQIVDRWSQRVFDVAYRMVGNPEDARDVRQRTFLRAFQALPGFNGNARFSTWLYQVTVNLSLDHLRAHHSREKRQRALRERRPLVPRQPETPEASATMSEDARRVRDAVAMLVPEQREIIVLKHYQGLTFTQIAEIVNEPVSTVKSRLYRALAFLREQLEECAP